MKRILLLGLLCLILTGPAAAFTDVSEGDWYGPAVLEMSDLFSGYPDGRFAPQAPYSRQQACLTIWRLSQAAA